MSSKVTIVLSVSILCMVSHAQTIAFQKGDLLFVVGNQSEFSSAITSTTGNNVEFAFDHVGIINSNEKGEVSVIEASPGKGVFIEPLDSFLLSAPLVNGKPGVVVKRSTLELPLDAIIENARSFIGQPYDWWYLPDNGKMYCSELVYESFKDTSGERIFTSRPMSFRSADGTIPEFWVKLYEELGEKVPEGVLGTNPTDLSNEESLSEIFRYF